jgi:hypothetical protein
MIQRAALSTDQCTLRSIDRGKHKQKFSQAYFLDKGVSLFIFHKVNPPTLALFLTWDDFADTLI